MRARRHSLAALALASGHASATVFTDDFSGSIIDPTRWTLATSSGNTVALDPAHHRVVMTQSGKDGSSSIAFDAVSITGDFDAQFRYLIVTPRPPAYHGGNQERVGLGADGLGDVERVSDSWFGGEVYLSNFSASGGTISSSVVTTELTGLFRLARVGAITTASFWNGSDWQVLQSRTGPTGAVAQGYAAVWNTYYPQDGMEIAFDDFRLDAPGVTVAVPTVTTAAVSGVTSSGASGGGEVTATGGARVAASGLCWGTAAAPAVGGACIAAGSGAGPFTGALSGLPAGTTLHLRAYATNLAGTGYGEDVTFATAGGAPGGGGGCSAASGLAWLVLLAGAGSVLGLRRRSPRPHRAETGPAGGRAGRPGSAAARAACLEPAGAVPPALHQAGERARPCAASGSSAG